MFLMIIEVFQTKMYTVYAENDETYATFAEM